MMKPVLYAHPFSSYCQKVLIALYENETPFTYRMLGPDDPTASEELEALWPLKRFPVLVEGGRTVIETSVIIEYLMDHHPGPSRLIPEKADAALEVRMMDRFFDKLRHDADAEGSVRPYPPRQRPRPLWGHRGKGEA
jgi:glutathione S-transferase